MEVTHLEIILLLSLKVDRSQMEFQAVVICGERVCGRCCSAAGGWLRGAVFSAFVDALFMLLQLSCDSQAACLFKVVLSSSPRL